MRASFALFLLSSLAALAQSSWPPGASHPAFPLWPHGAPGIAPNLPPESDIHSPNDRDVAGRPVFRLGNVSDPSITLYAPTAPANGAAVLVFPGGGYRILAIDLEGTEVCSWLTSSGITCLLVKYRVPGTGPYPVGAAALQDAQRAVGLARSHASDWHIDPNKIGVLGFSAGAHLAAAVSTHFDRRIYPTVDAADALSCRPDFQVVVYPGYLAVPGPTLTFTADIPVTAQTPPAIVIQAEDDPVRVENAVAYFMALKSAKVPAELHIYAQGGHGYGLRRTALPITTWPSAVETWLRTIGILPQQN